MTGIILDTPTTGGPPKVKFDKVGDYVIVGIVNVDEFHQHTMKGEALYWDDEKTKPKMGKRVTGLVVEANNAYVTANDVDRPVQSDELVTFYCDGGRHFTWKEAVADLDKRLREETGKSGAVQVGDVMKWWLDKIEPATQRGYDDRKVQVAKIRRPKAEDGDLADRCVAAYHEQQTRPAVDAPTFTPPNSTSPAPAADIADPF